MVYLDRLTTKGGDKGETSLGDNSRVRKDSLRIHAIGDVDEANAAIGMVRLVTTGEADAILARIQNDLFDVGADLCQPGNNTDALRVTTTQIERLEAETKQLTSQLPPLRSFVFPGGRNGSAQAHVARTIVRRAERDVTSLLVEDPASTAVLVYLNRLSDLLFALARTLAQEEPLWRPGATQ